ncbi:MAG: hypothetical protein C4534_10215 [Gaiellales bacterium]|nr:MAG: hypothetical protein C4534_10215 [Gaiellales bacterium]
MQVSGTHAAHTRKGVKEHSVRSIVRPILASSDSDGWKGDKVKGEKEGMRMRKLGNHRLLIAVLVGGLALALVPVAVEAKDTAWLDEITALVVSHQELAKFEGRERSYDPYLEQLGIVRMTVTTGDGTNTYVAMNRLMDMLQTDPKGGGIPTWSAKEIFDFCGKVTPAKYHDAARHHPELSKGGFDYWDDNVMDLGGGG